jgi:hypothetical protein
MKVKDEDFIFFLATTIFRHGGSPPEVQTDLDFYD